MKEKGEEWTTAGTVVEAGKPSGDMLDGVHVCFNPTVEPGKCFCVGVGKNRDELQLHCTEETWHELQTDAPALRATRHMIRTVKTSRSRQTLARMLGTPNRG